MTCQHLHARPHLKKLPVCKTSATNPSARAIADFVDDEDFGWEDPEELRTQHDGERYKWYTRQGAKRRKQTVERKLDRAVKEDLY